MRATGPSLALLFAAAALAACGGTREAAPAPGPRTALVVVPLEGPAPAAGERAVARVEVASAPAARERGLMFRESLPQDTGMLFAYPDDRLLGYWMKSCPAPLAAAFLDGEGRILNIEEMAPGDGVADDDLPRYASRGKARYVLEMEGRWFARKGIREGDRADLSAALRGVLPR